MPQYHAFIAPFREGNDGMRDASPTVLKEAMACGVPIITTDFFAIPDIVGQGSALLVPSADRHALADAIFQIQDMDAENRSIMGRNGRERVIQKFSIIQQCQRLKDIWEGLA